jgi:hypothetical protein
MHRRRVRRQSGPVEPVNSLCYEGTTLRLLTTVVGNINGVDFRAEGVSRCLEPGHTVGELQFDKAIPNFTPMLCKSWQCKQHPPQAKMTYCEGNPIADFLDDGGRILEYTTIEYPQVGDKILVTSVCERPDLEVQTVYQTRVGTYSGPVDIIDQMPYDIEIDFDGPGRAHGSSVRTVVRANGEKISIRYEDEYFFSGGFTLPHSLTFKLSGEATYHPDESRYVLDTYVLGTRPAVHSPVRK